jgi:hypothetical protein
MASLEVLMPPLEMTSVEETLQTRRADTSRLSHHVL